MRLPNKRLTIPITRKELIKEINDGMGEPQDLLREEASLKPCKDKTQAREKECMILSRSFPSKNKQ